MNWINLLKSLGEAILILLIANLPVLLTIGSVTIENPGDGFKFAAVMQAFRQVYSITDLFGYLAGLLASTLVFYWMNHWTFRVYTGRAVFFTAAPLIVLILATPLFQASTSGKIENPTAAATYAYLLLGTSVLLWVAALYNQRQIGSHEYDFGGSQESSGIQANLSDPRGKA